LPHEVSRKGQLSWQRNPSSAEILVMYAKHTKVLRESKPKSI
jgi:hypothetical protein